jgi:E3 ubiquitin-protein ligase ZNF598
MAAQPANADLVVRTAIRAYKASESGAKDLIGTVWTVLDGNVENTATVVNALVDLLDDEDKKRDLLAAWNGFKIEVGTPSRTCACAPR